MHLSYSPDGSRIATGGNDGAKVWSTESGRLLHHWPDAGATWWLDFSPDGGRVMTGSWFPAGHGVVSLFDATDGQTLFGRDFTRWIDGIVFCADGRTAVSVLHQSGQLDVWDLESGEAKTIRPGAPANAFMRCLARHPRANQVALVIEDTIELWDMDRRQLVNTLQVDGEPLYCLGFNHDGTRLFSGDTGGVVKVWDLDTGEAIYTLQAHESLDAPSYRKTLGVTSLTISPDGNTLATAGADGLVKLWETLRPSKEIARQRQIVREATEAVNRRYQTSPAHQDVMASLKADSALDRKVQQTAIEIANARGDRPSGPFVIPAKESKQIGYEVHERLNEARRSFAELVKQASHSDFDAVDPNSPTECDGQWVWDANHQVVPDFTLEELEYLLDPLVEQHPQAHQFLCLRGFVNGHRGRFEEAQADFRTALERVPEKTGLWTTYAYVLSTLYVHQGEFDRYRELSDRAVDQALEMDGPRLKELTAKMYLFSGQGGSRVDDAVESARSSMSGLPHNNFRWFSLAHGIAEYRRGNWELAIEVLNQAQAPIGYQAPTRMAAANLFQALAYAQLGEVAQARTKQAAAAAIMNRPGYGERDWWNAFIAEAAHEELQQFLASAGDDANSATTENSEPATQPRSQRIVTPDSEWKWLLPANGIDPATDDPDFHEAFCSPSYDDTHWQTGTDRPGPSGGFGYGDPAGVDFELPAEGDRKSAYLRHHFTTGQAYDELIISMQRDDGVIVYLDGKEVGRNNVGDGVDAFDLLARADVAGGQETWTGFYALSDALEPGEHVLAISLHNSVAQDSDLRIAEISLWGTPASPATDGQQVDDTR